MDAPVIVTRSGNGAALTAIQHDANLNNLLATITALIAKAALVSSDEGVLVNDVLSLAAQITDNLITLAKLAALSGAGLGAFLRADKTTGAIGPALIFSDKQADATEQHLTGAQTAALLSTLTFTAVPAGDVMCWGLVLALRNAGANGGTVSLMAPDGTTVIANAPTHSVDLGADAQWVPLPFFGKLAGWTGGDLALTIVFETGEDTSDINFGTGGDGRFGRSVMVLAGL